MPVGQLTLRQQIGPEGLSQWQFPAGANGLAFQFDRESFQVNTVAFEIGFHLQVFDRWQRDEIRGEFPSQLFGVQTQKTFRLGERSANGHVQFRIYQADSSEVSHAVSETFVRRRRGSHIDWFPFVPMQRARPRSGYKCYWQRSLHGYHGTRK